MKPGDKAFAVWDITWYELEVKRVTKTKIILGYGDDRSWRREFRKKDGWDFERSGIRYKILSKNQYNLDERDRVLLEKECQNLAYELDKMNWQSRYYDIETLQAIKAIVDTADKQKALDIAAGLR